MGSKPEVYPEKGFESFNMSLDCLDEFAVQGLFGFLSENLNFESLQDELNQRKLLSEKETKDYIYHAPGKHFRGGKIIKLMIKKRRCKDFVACLQENSHHSHICEKILEVKENQQLVKEGAIGIIPAFTVTDDLLHRHFECLYTYLEPRKIADEMFEAHCITVSDHDIVTDSSKKYKRLRSLLKILKMKTLHGSFLLTLQCLRCDLVVKTLKTDKQCITQPSKYAMWIQHSFTVLQEELPDSDYVTFLMKRVLDFSNTSDIDSCKGPLRQKSKLLKILLMKGQRACEFLLSAIKDVLKREDMILNMESKSNAVMNRGKPVLIPSLTCLETGCLQEHEDLLYEDLEPIVVCDYLLEEGAVNILEHDIITETKQRQKQIKRLIEKLTNKKDCFHLFLHILQKEEFETILKEIENPPLEAEEEPTPRLKWKLSQSVVKVQDDVCNEPIEMRLTVYGQCGEQVEQVLYERLRSSDTEILGEALSRGQMDIYDVSLGSVVIRLRPVTDQAVQTLISAKENNKLLLMIFGILQKVDIAKIMSDTESLKIRVQVFYDMLATSKQDTKISKVPFVEKLVKVNRNVLLTELDPMVLIPALSKSKSFPESVINSLHKAPSRYEKVNIISTFVENGSPDVVNEFRTVLKDRGHCDILELLDPSVHHSKADEIRKKITSNYENILNEMQMTLAKETLSKCCGNTGMIKEKILPKYGNRKQRMSEFLRFILQDDHNVLEFEKMLKRNGLYELLLSEESVPEDQISNQDIEVTVVKDTFPTTSEGSLFDSVITLSYTEGEVVEDRSQLSSEEQVPDSKTALPNDEEQSGKQTVDMRTTKVGCVADTMNRYTSTKRHDRDRQIVENEIISIPDQSLVSCVTDTLPTPTTAAGKNTLDELKTSNHSPDMAGANTWTEYVNSQELQDLFGVFNVEVPDDRSKLSFAKGFLEASKLTDFVAEIRSLANRVVLCKRLRDEDKKPGTVYVYEVGVKSMENRIVIEEKEGREIDSFSEKNEDLVKVILIESNLQNIIETEYKVYKKYQGYFPTEHVHVQHMSEQFVEIAKLSAKRKIESFKHVIESIRESIPLHSIEYIVRKAVNRALSKENITQLCNDAVIAESGNSMSDAYYCRSGSTIERLKGELVKKTMKSVSNHLGSEISAEIQKHIESEIKSKFDPSLFNFNFGLASSVIVDTLSVGAIALVTALIFPMAGLFIAVVGSLMTLFSAVNVNSPLWRRDVANEIYKKISDKKQKVLEELASDMKKRCEKTADQLTGIIRQLEDHLRRIHLIDQQKLFSEWEKQNVHVEPKIVHEKPEVHAEPEIVHEKMSIQDIFKDERVLEHHESISRYNYGTKGGTQVFKVLLRYNDENAKREIKENISEGIHPEFTVLTERFEEIQKNLAPTVKMENSSPAVDVEERNRLSQIINEQADYVYENHSDVIGLRISNVRCVDGRLIQEPCIVIYCYDKLFVPAGEKKLPESLGGYPCDIRDNIILFGALLGSSIGIPFSQVRGSVGFLVKSNIPLQVPVTGFLTAAHVVFNDIDSLYKEKALLSKCRHNKLCTFAQESHLIVKPAWIESADYEPIGEVVESFFGNYKPDGDDSAAFGIDAAFIKTYPPKQEVNENRRMQIVDENNLKYDGSTKVLKKGKETCDTEGFLISNSASIAVRRENQPDSGYQFDNCFEIRSLNEKEDFFARGDSGSAVFVKEDGKLKPLGIAFAFSAEGSTYVCNIHHIAKMFNLSIYQEEENIETLDG